MAAESLIYSPVMGGGVTILYARSFILMFSSWSRICRFTQGSVSVQHNADTTAEGGDGEQLPLWGGRTRRAHVLTRSISRAFKKYLIQIGLQTNPAIACRRGVCANKQLLRFYMGGGMKPR